MDQLAKKIYRALLDHKTVLVFSQSMRRLRPIFEQVTNLIADGKLDSDCIHINYSQNRITLNESIVFFDSNIDKTRGKRADILFVDSSYSNIEELQTLISYISTSNKSTIEFFDDKIHTKNVEVKCQQIDFEGDTLKIKKFDDYDWAYEIYIDGYKIEKVRRVTIDIEAGYKPTITLDIIEG